MHDEFPRNGKLFLARKRIASRIPVSTCLQWSNSFLISARVIISNVVFSLTDFSYCFQDIMDWKWSWLSSWRWIPRAWCVKSLNPIFEFPKLIHGEMAFPMPVAGKRQQEKQNKLLVDTLYIIHWRPIPWITFARRLYCVGLKPVPLDLSCFAGKSWIGDFDRSIVLWFEGRGFFQVLGSDGKNPNTKLKCRIKKWW